MSVEAVTSDLNQSQSREEIQSWGKLIPCLSSLNSIVLKKESIKIGRAASCDVIIDNRVHTNDSSISKEHCLLTKDSEGNIYIIDLSKNGTFLNGVKIGKNKKQNLKNNDKISLVKEANDVYIFQLISVEELPDTLTGSNCVDSSCSPPNIVIPTWGRLISCLIHLNSFDLYNPSFKVGRSPQCDVDINSTEINPIIKMRFSKEHFVIFKNPENPVVTYIKDLSKSGTFLNGRLIGENNKNILQHNDTIAIGSKRTRVFAYKSMSASATNYLPSRLKKKYEISNFLGKGGCGEVTLAYEKTTCKLYAIKRILKGKSTASQMAKLNHPSKIRTEIQILKSLSHPHLINMKKIIETDDEVFIVLEYMKGGMLTDRIISNVPLKESNVKFLFYQMVLAVQFLHLNSIAHRDLKPENILLSSDDTDTIVKVSDFGLSKITDDDDVMKTVCGTFCYMAPEVLNVQVADYDKQADIWSLGVILFYMLSKKLPFESPNRIELTKNIITGTYDIDGSSWNGISYLAKDLVTRMLTVNPQERITISEILSHSWLAKDVAMQYRVKSLREEQEESSSTDDTDNSCDAERTDTDCCHTERTDNSCDTERPTKRFRSGSD